MGTSWELTVSLRTAEAERHSRAIEQRRSASEAEQKHLRERQTLVSAATAAAAEWTEWRRSAEAAVTTADRVAEESLAWESQQRQLETRQREAHAELTAEQERVAAAERQSRQEREAAAAAALAERAATAERERLELRQSAAAAAEADRLQLQQVNAQLHQQLHQLRQRYSSFSCVSSFSSISPQRGTRSTFSQPSTRCDSVVDLHWIVGIFGRVFAQRL